eukprot:CAMPEP_0176338632 /NCGR_PEP_ID=MMETSP0126-20121128/106_1 /TAXON_ID=141414 ORGANISM="Strombidinopsis acuminatum, Strain SPMC142" /NCGR_SAMPLE_ID=MMETSP0126 /ASSEMBLY_ACC=CAM_ASM_000229 /LENGTH=61 /DNA_ID=CAMNT_0017681711 /DNA_START=1681 /DNA_END=1863 /DNA_ORIENTATION=+
MKMADKNQVNDLGKVKWFVLTTIQKEEIWEALLVNHVDATVEHDCATANFSNNTTTTNILT